MGCPAEKLYRWTTSRQASNKEVKSLLLLTLGVQHTSSSWNGAYFMRLVIASEAEVERTYCLVRESQAQQVSRQLADPQMAVQEEARDYAPQLSCTGPISRPLQLHT